jgi:predicted RecB family endonuclease
MMITRNRKRRVTTFKMIKDLQKENEMRIKALSENIGGLNNSMGALVESIFTAGLMEKFGAYEYNFKRVYRNVRVYGENDRIVAEIDILLSSNQWAMAIEVKRNAEHGDVEYHKERMARIQASPTAEIAGKKLLGAIAFVEASLSVRELAHKEGFFVFEFSGEAFNLAPMPDGFVPRVY